MGPKVELTKRSPHDIPRELSEPAELRLIALMGSHCHRAVARTQGRRSDQSRAGRGQVGHDVAGDARPGRETDRSLADPPTRKSGSREAEKKQVRGLWV